jgi:hypothetical protein
MHYFATKVVKHPFYSIGRKLMFGSVSDQFANLRHVKRAILVFEPDYTILGYQSCEAFILLDWNQNDDWECFGAFREPSTRKKMQNMCFGAECTISGCQSCEESILLHWTQNDVWECLRLFRLPLACK